MMDHGYGWMDGFKGGGMWIWMLFGVLVVVSLVIVLIKLSNKKP